MENPFEDILIQRQPERQRLIRNLREKGFHDETILRIISETPREVFMSKNLHFAYEDDAMAIDCGQTISQPYTVAYMTEALRLEPGMKTLEIGTGSGYQAFILYLLGAKVYSVERIEQLYLKCLDLFSSKNIDIKLKCSDGTMGWEEESPFERIIITAAAPKIPKSLMDQLAIGGRLVAPVGAKELQKMHIVDRISETEFRIEKRNNFKFVPLIGLEGWES